MEINGIKLEVGEAFWFCLRPFGTHLHIVKEILPNGDLLTFYRHHNDGKWYVALVLLAGFGQYARPLEFTGNLL